MFYTKPSTKRLLHWSVTEQYNGSYILITINLSDTDPLDLLVWMGVWEGGGYGVGTNTGASIEFGILLAWNRLGWKVLSLSDRRVDPCMPPDSVGLDLNQILACTVQQFASLSCWVCRRKTQRKKKKYYFCIQHMECAIISVYVDNI